MNDSKRIMISSRVRHDFSGIKGTVMQYKRSTGNYNYLVRWDNDPNSVWMRRKVLVLL
jgi:hypothetical protein